MLGEKVVASSRTPVPTANSNSDIVVDAALRERVERQYGRSPEWDEELVHL